jgi:hypothetical protein
VEYQYHHVWLEETDDAADIIMPDGTAVLVFPDGMTEMRVKDTVVFRRSLYSEPMFTKRELAMLLDALMVLYHEAEAHTVNDGSGLLDIEALQHGIEAMLDPAWEPGADRHSRGRAVYEAASREHLVDGPEIPHSALTEEEKLTWDKIAAAGR